jgi:hypothetical protein
MGADREMVGELASYVGRHCWKKEPGKEVKVTFQCFRVASIEKAGKKLKMSDLP